MNRWSKFFLLGLRIAIGWHFLYEGLFKMDSDRGTVHYATARYTLQAATARLHDYFARTPADQRTRAAALARIDGWHDEIVRAFAARKALDEPQKARLAALRDEVKVAAVAAPAPTVDEVVNFDWSYLHEEILKVAPEPEPEAFTSLAYLQNSAGPFRPVFRGLLPDAGGQLTAAAVRRRLDERHDQILRHFRDAGRPFDEEQRKRFAAARDAIVQSSEAILNDPAFQTRLADFQVFEQRVRETSNRPPTPFENERLEADRKKLDVMTGELLAFANEPLSELAVQAQAIATASQLGAGPFARPRSGIEWVDSSIQFILAAIGVCLLLGIYTPVAAIAAAAQLAVFYFASPPWPGLPAASTGGHYLFIDRNLIELVAALVVATTPVTFTQPGDSHDPQ